MANRFQKSWVPGCDNSDGSNYCHAISVAQEFAAVDKLSALPRAVQLPELARVEVHQGTKSGGRFEGRAGHSGIRRAVKVSAQAVVSPRKTLDLNFCC